MLIRKIYVRNSFWKSIKILHPSTNKIWKNFWKTILMQNFDHSSSPKSRSGKKKTYLKTLHTFGEFLCKRFSEYTWCTTTFTLTTLTWQMFTLMDITWADTYVCNFGFLYLRYFDYEKKYYKGKMARNI